MSQEYEAAREEAKNKSSEDFNVMKITLESALGELEKKFEARCSAICMLTIVLMIEFFVLKMWHVVRDCAWRA